MSVASLNINQCYAVIDFLKLTLPGSDSQGEWFHYFASAYQIGTSALVALGQADETPVGAVERKAARLPPELPRWDDICIAVLWLAQQQNLLEYLHPDGRVLPLKVGNWLIVQAVAAHPRKANINSAHGLGPAFAAPEVCAVLDSLGVVADGKWTATAETLLWRCEPPEWTMEFGHDDRFAVAVKRAIAEIPDAIRKEISDLVMISEEVVMASIAQRQESKVEARNKLRSNSPVVSVFTQEDALRGLEFHRRHQLDWLFFRKWRLEDGWLNAMEQKRALEIFHDPVAIAMRRAVLGRLYPDLPQFSR